MGTEQPVNFRDVAEEIMRTVPLFVTLDDNDFYIYKNGVYTNIGSEAELNNKIRSLADKMSIDRGISKPLPVTKRFVAETLDYIRVHRIIQRDAIGTNETVLNLKNGLLDINTLELKQHTSNHYSVIQYPVNYKPEADCPSIKKFLTEAVNPGDLDTLLEYTGYSLIPGNSFKKFIMLYGGTDAGKTTFCNLIEAVFGCSNVAHVSPQSLQEDRFSKIQLYGKIANIVPDAGDKPLYGTETIKTITGNDIITADQKYKSPIRFMNKSHMFWGANKLPDIKNDDLAFFERALLVNFPHKFMGTKQNRGLSDQLTTDEELSGFLNVLLNAWERLFKRGKFSESATATEIRFRYKQNSNPIARFVEEHTKSSMYNITKFELYRHYENWCKVNGVRVVQINIFGKELKKQGFEDTQIRIGDVRPTVWLNVEYIDRKPTIQTDLASKVDYGSSIVISPTLDIDTGEGEGEISIMTKVSRVNPYNVDNVLKGDNIERLGNTLDRENPLKANTVETVERFSVKGSTLDSKFDLSLLRRDLVNFVKMKYPNLMVDDLPCMVNAFCTKWPGYKDNPGSQYVSTVAEKMKERGWRL